LLDAVDPEGVVVVDEVSANTGDAGAADEAEATHPRAPPVADGCRHRPDEGVTPHSPHYARRSSVDGPHRGLTFLETEPSDVREATLSRNVG
jgi:hypothetical protein